MTQNNNSSMKTVVETFIIEETQDLIYDNEKLDQWNKMVEELGLQGQTKIVVKEKSPIPFLHMKAPLVRVFETLCPRKVDIAEYDKTPIPVEILDLVLLSKREEYFDDIQIWYDDETPDPACIGILMDFYSYNRNWSTIRHYNNKAEMLADKSNNPEIFGTNTSIKAHYIIGRWADVKQSLEELTAKAKALFTAKKKDEYQKEIRDAQRKIEDLENEANISFGYTIGSDPLPF